ncbi:MAG: hypothetical protein ACKVQC_09105 [Elusimicrobiota bacterium]
MKLYRVFPWHQGVPFFKEGGPLYVPRKRQGSQRHDIPDLDGVIYSSQIELSAVVESLSQFSGSSLENADFISPTGNILSLATYELSDYSHLINLDDPKTLSKFKLRPSEVITRIYSGTRKMSERFWREGAIGFIWPSSQEASWPNVTLFESRVRKYLKVVANSIQPLHVSHKIVIEAAFRLKIKLTTRAGQ